MLKKSIIILIALIILGAGSFQAVWWFMNRSTTVQPIQVNPKPETANSYTKSDRLPDPPAETDSSPADNRTTDARSSSALIEAKNIEEARKRETQIALEEKHQAYLDSLKTATGQPISSFQTSLAGHNASGRVTNIRLASNKISGVILMPNEIFSFNTTVGDSNDPKQGWQLATVIVGKQFEQGYGGGICQVSSTLYNAVLQANLTVKERYSHSLPVGYVAPGHDATVSYPELDFKFANSLSYPIRIETGIAGDSVFCKILALPSERVTG